MRNFVYDIPTKVYFGKGQLSALADEILQYKNILIVYGQGSIIKSGLLNRIKEIITASDKKYYELSGVKPNPQIDTVRKGVEICHQHHVDLVLAVGGGSVIDTAKAIAFGYYYQGDPWDVYRQQMEIVKALPVASILTLAATGSEMNPYTVISNEETEEKLGIGSNVLYPVFSILDPQLTYSVSAYQTASGAVDIFSHVLEQYFCPVADTYIQNRLCESILNTVIHYAPIAISEPENYDARANLMWAGSLALNGMLSYGKIGDWSVHGIEHEVSAIYNLTHGVGLAILYPYWMKYTLNENTVDKYVEYALNVWNVENTGNLFAMANEGIDKTRAFFNKLNMPDVFSKVNIDDVNFEVMAEKAVSLYKNNQMGMFVKLSKQDVEAILKMAK